MYILVIGDTHIPDRAYSVPEKMAKIIESGRPWDIVVFTGDFTDREVYDWVVDLGRKVYYVSGNMDYLPLPKKQVFELDVRMGVHHGDGVYPRGDTKGLTRIARELGVKLLFTGHTHSPFIKHGLTKEILLVNPGSLTGVWGGGGGSMQPSMFILEISGGAYLFEHYVLRDNELSSKRIKVLLKDGEWIIP